MDYRRGIIAGIAPLAVGWGDHGGPQPIVRMQVGTTHPLIHHLLQTQGGLPVHRHAYFQESNHHAGVLTDGPVALGAEPRVIEDLGHGVAGRGGFLPFIGRAQGANIVQGVVVGDELKGVGDAGDQVFLADICHYG